MVSRRVLQVLMASFANVKKSCGARRFGSENSPGLLFTSMLVVDKDRIFFGRRWLRWWRFNQTDDDVYVLRFVLFDWNRADLPCDC